MTQDPQHASTPSAPGASDQPAGAAPGSSPSTAARHMAPGDEAPAGTPGTGEDVCPQCGGSGEVSDNGQQVKCPVCEGAGKVTVGIGGA